MLARGLVAFRELATVRACGAVCAWGGLGYYEVEIVHAGSGMRFGFCSPESPGEVSDGAGVGDDDLSWGVDGDRGLKWHAGQDCLFGGRWRDGDVVGLACDLRAGSGGGRILVSLNGNFAPPYGAAFELPAAGLQGGLMPALTAESGLFRLILAGGPAGLPFRHAQPSPE